MNRKELNLGIYIVLSLFFSSKATAELSPNAFAISSLLQKSDVIVAGYVSDVTKSPSEYMITFTTETTVKGSANGETINISVPMANWLHIPTEAYLSKNKRYIVFLKSIGTSYEIVNHAGGVLRIESLSDIETVYAAKENNNNLFSRASINELKAMFSNFTSKEMNRRLLLDIEKYITADDELFLQDLLESGDKNSILFGIQQVGRQNVKSLESVIISKLQNDNDPSTQLLSLVALGEMNDPKNANLILSFLDHSDQGIRAAAIQALGKMSNVEVINPLRERFPIENDLGNRISIITAIERNPNKGESIKALKELRSVPAKPLVSRILNKRISGLE